MEITFGHFCSYEHLDLRNYKCSDYAIWSKYVNLLGAQKDFFKLLNFMVLFIYFNKIVVKIDGQPHGLCNNLYFGFSVRILIIKRSMFKNQVFQRDWFVL